MLPPLAHSGWPGKGLIAWFVRNPVAANLLMILFLLGGGITAWTLQTEVFPTLQPRNVQSGGDLSGATPGDVEDSITRRIEEAVIGLEGVDRVRSVASEGAARSPSSCRILRTRKWSRTMWRRCLRDCRLPTR
ncbi:MAG: efflux RND transporter permease subunit [Oceanicaulis sp.]|nr:efflux RND transporter permease subunit [Oceanicaulis sp.]